MAPATVACPHCQEPLATGEVLDAGTFAVPETSLLHFRCPRCRGPAVARLGEGHLQVGAGSDRFLGAAVDPSLSVRPEAAWLDCWHGGRYRRFPAGKAA